MKNLLKVLILTLALNFLAVAGLTGWLWQSKKLDSKAVLAIKEILFPAPKVAEPATQPSTTEPTSRPVSPLEQLLARKSGTTSAAAQVDLIQQSVDSQMGQLDQRQRQLEDLQRLVAAAQSKLAHDRAALESDRRQLTGEQQEAARLAGDKGFQDSLNLYNAMPSKQVKGIFMSLDEPTVTRYLQAMQPRTAAKIIKEFKSPEELERIRKVIDQMRQSPGDPATRPASADAKDGQPQ